MSKFTLRSIELNWLEGKLEKYGAIADAMALLFGNKNKCEQQFQAEMLRSVDEVIHYTNALLDHPQILEISCQMSPLKIWLGDHLKFWRTTVWLHLELIDDTIIKYPAVSHKQTIEEFLRDVYEDVEKEYGKGE